MLILFSSKSTLTQEITIWPKPKWRINSFLQLRRRKPRSPEITSQLLRTCHKGRPRWWPANWLFDMNSARTFLLPFLMLRSLLYLHFTCVCVSLSFSLFVLLCPFPSLAFYRLCNCSEEMLFWSNVCCRTPSFTRSHVEMKRFGFWSSRCSRNFYSQVWMHGYLTETIEQKPFLGFY